MAANTTTKVATLTGAAKNDVFGVNEGTGTYSLNVLANDPGSAALYSLAQVSGFSSAQFPVVASTTLPSGASIAIVNGKIEYTNSNAQALAAGELFTDTFSYTVRMANGALSTATVSVTLTGENDAASISGDHVGSVTEDGVLTAAGTLTVVDVDHNEAHTLAGTGNTTNGSYAVDTDGHWSFSADNAAIQHLAAGATVTDTFTVTSKDGTASQDVTITITGVNDAASIAGDNSGNVTEDGTLTASGVLVVSDVDDGEAHAQAGAGSTANGSYTVDADGNWSFSADNSAIQHLAAGATATDTFTVTSQDGTASQDVTITLTGVNDEAVIAGDLSGAVTEDGVQLAQGVLTVSDVDDDESHFAAVPDDALVGQYGDFTFDADTGAWSYQLRNSDAAVQALGANDTVADELVVTSLDGTSQTISVSIQGADEPLVPQAAANPVTQFTVNQGIQVTNGIVTITGFDSNDVLHYVNQFQYVGTHVTDYLSNGIMDTAVDFIYQQNPNSTPKPVEVILIGYTGLQDSQLVG